MNGISSLSATEIELVDGGMTSAQVRDLGSSAAAFAGASAMFGFAPGVAMGASIALNAYAIAEFMDM